MRFRAGFFDSDAVMRLLPKAKRQAFSRGGAFIQRRAKSLIRRSKKTSLPGQPPKSHKGHLRRLLYFGYDTAAESLVVGPVPLRTVAKAPESLEYGGTQRIKNPRRTIRRLGQPGEIAVYRSRSDINRRRTRYLQRSYLRTVQVKRGGGIGSYRYVAFGRLKTPAQVSRANRLNADLYGPALVALTIAARPFMNPAMDAEIAAGTIVEMFRDSIRK